MAHVIKNAKTSTNLKQTLGFHYGINELFFFLIITKELQNRLQKCKAKGEKLPYRHQKLNE